MLQELSIRHTATGGSCRCIFFLELYHSGRAQGIYSGPLLFLLFICDIVNDIDSNIRLFADGTSLFIIVENAPFAATCLNPDLGKIT